VVDTEWLGVKALESSGSVVTRQATTETKNGSGERRSRSFVIPSDD
jgi:hypothetical protein